MTGTASQAAGVGVRPWRVKIDQGTQTPPSPGTTMVKTRLASVLLRSPRRAAVTAVPMVMLDVIRMKVMRAMKAMLNTWVRSGQGEGLAWRRKA